MEKLNLVLYYARATGRVLYPPNGEFVMADDDLFCYVFSSESCLRGSEVIGLDSVYKFTKERLTVWVLNFYQVSDIGELGVIAFGGSSKVVATILKTVRKNISKILARDRGEVNIQEISDESASSSDDGATNNNNINNKKDKKMKDKTKKKKNKTKKKELYEGKGEGEKKFSWKRVKGWLREILFCRQRHPNKVELLSFVPKKEQKDFSQYLYSNYQVWNKERRRCFYRCWKFKKNSIPIINNAPSFTLNSVLSLNILPATVSFIATTTERIKTKPNLKLNSKSNSIIKSKMISSAFSSGSASSFHTSCTLPAPLFPSSSITSACSRITSNKTFTSHVNLINVQS